MEGEGGEGVVNRASSRRSPGRNQYTQAGRKNRLDGRNGGLALRLSPSFLAEALQPFFVCLFFLFWTQNHAKKKKERNGSK